MSTRLGLLLLAAFAALLALGAWWLAPHSEPRALRMRSASRWSWTALEPVAYDLRVESATRGAGPAAGEQRGLLEAVLILTPQEAHAVPGQTGVRCSAQLAQVLQAPEFRCAGLSQPFELTLALDGRMDSFEFAPEVSPDDRGRLEELVRMFQFVLPDGNGARAGAWSAQESHTLGTYRARYEQDGGRLRKLKQEYLEPPDGEAGFGRMRVLRSEAEAHLSSAFWLTDAWLEETIELRVDESVLMSFEVRASLSRRSGGARELLASAAARTADEQAGEQGRVPAQDSASVDHGARLEDALSILRASDGRDMAAFAALKAALTEDPDLTARVHELLNDAELSDGLQATLVLALERVGHQRAQESLGQLAEDPAAASRLRLRAVVALGGVERPGATMAPALWRLQQARAASSELSDTAALALGSAGRHLRELDPGRYEELRGDLYAALAGAHDDGERAALLMAVGNTTDAHFGDYVAWWMQSGSVLVRANAASTLGLLGAPTGDQADPLDLLVAALPREHEARVRSSMAGSLARLGRADAEAIRVVSAELAREDSPEVGYRLATYLVANLEQFPESRTVLEDLLSRTASRRVRELLVRAL